MKQWRAWFLLLLLIFLPAACDGHLPAGDLTPVAVEVTEVGSTAEPTPQPEATSAAKPTARATRVGVDYVLLLPREAAVPAGWAMSQSPGFETRRPQPGDTYRFACRDLPARGVGAASVGYRHLEGMPSLHIEYVVYPTAEDAAAALADMQLAVDECAEFMIGDGERATSAAFSALEFPAYGDAGFAAALETDSSVSGQLQTHMVKIRNDHVVVGINHTAYAAEPPPDAALTESLAALAVSNLEDGPAAPGD